MKKVFVLFIFIFLIFPFFVLAADKIEINTASLERLDEITEIGPVLAQRIIDARPFSSIDDLIKVQGIGEKTLQKIKDQGLACIGCQAEISAEEPALIIYPTGIILNEILPSAEGADEENEWIELYNTNNFEIDLSSLKIKDKEGVITSYSLPENTKISAYGYLVLKRPDTKITLNNTTDGLIIYWPNEKIIDSMAYENALPNQSYNKIGENWQWSTSLTPGAKNIITQNNAIQKGTSSSQARVEGLPKIEKSVNSKENNVNLATISQSINPWFLFLTALFITILSVIIVLFIKFKFSKHVRT